MTEFEIITSARSILASRPRNKLTQSTIKDYQAKLLRLTKNARFSESKKENFFSPLLVEALNTKKKTSWYAMRAALIFFAQSNLKTTLAEQDRLQILNRASTLAGQVVNYDAWREMVEKVKHWHEALQSVLNAELLTEDRIPRHTKRQDMRGLPDTWREQIISRMPKYELAALASAITGCRPGELLKGITFQLVQGYLIANIVGVKVDLKMGKGQEWRKLSWKLDHSNLMVRELINRTRNAGGVLVVNIKNASSFSKSMSNAGQRLWPKRHTTITPYCMRHQASSDMKNDGHLSESEISGALGHQSNVTKNTYGRAQMGKAGGVCPHSVLVAQPIRSKSMSSATRRVTEGIEIKKRDGKLKNYLNLSSTLIGLQGR